MDAKGRSKAACRVLVTGASGLLGANFAHSAAARWPVVGIYCRHAISIPNSESMHLDLADSGSVVVELARIQPSIIVHLASITDVDWCEDHPVEAARLNVEVTKTLASWAAANECRMVFMSTDSVFDGIRGGYLESDSTGPMNVYARTKLHAEHVVRSLSPDNLVIRANFYGWNAQPKQSLAEWILSLLETGRRVPGFVDAIFSPLLANTLSDIMCDMIDRKAAGTFHVASPDCVSKYQFARAVAGTFGLDPDRVDRTELGAASLRAKRSPNTTLRTAKLRAELGIRPPLIEADLTQFKSLRESGYAARLRAACPSDKREGR